MSTNDYSYVLWIQQLFGPESRWLWSFLTSAGDGMVLLAICCLLAWTMDTRLALRIGFALSVAAVTVGSGKIILQEPRPYLMSDAVQPWMAIGGFAMPSGHAAGSICGYSLLSQSVRRWWFTVAAAVLILLIGVSRLYFGVHTLNQVLWGWGAGLAIVLIVSRYEPQFLLWWAAVGWLRQVVLVLLVTIILCIAHLMIFDYRAAGIAMPAEWVRRFQLAQAYEESLAGIAGVTHRQLDLVEPQRLFNIALFLGTSLAGIYVGQAGGFTRFTWNERLVNTFTGCIVTSALLLLAVAVRQQPLLLFVVISVMPLVLVIGVPVISRFFYAQRL